MSYIVAVNPQILSIAGLDFNAVLTATVLAAALGSILMGLVARLPYAVAPGMGINAFFTFELVRNAKNPVSPEVALGLVVWSGIIFLVLSLTPARRAIARAIPIHLREAIAGGIGLFLAFIGLQSVGLVADHPATLVTLGKLDARHLLFLFGLVVAGVLHRAGKPYAFLVAILATTALALPLDRPDGVPAKAWVQLPDSVFQAPDLTLIFSADLAGSFEIALLAPLLTLLFTDLFDSLSTFLGVAQASGLVDEDGEPLRIERALVVDAGATLISGLAGTSSATTYIESTAGIEAGGRTGLTAVVAGLCFLPLMFCGPLVHMIPRFATAPILVIVGALMARASANLGTRPLEERLPAFLVLILIPLTFSITTGLLWGFVLHTVFFLCCRRAEELTPTMWTLFVIAIALLGMQHWNIPQ